MLELLWLIPALPFASFLVLALAGQRLPRAAVAWLGVGSVGVSAVVAMLISLEFLRSPPPGHAFVQALWTWIPVGSFRPEIAFHLDALSVIMTLVITFVGFLIHLYSAEFMRGDDGYSRFFAYMNLFVGSMLVLVLAENLALLYLGWEGVGLGSYLLIGFWYRDPANGAAARKAFIMTRMGDTALVIGLFLIFHHLGTLRIQEVLTLAPQEWPAGSALAIAAAALLLGGAIGKSAQLPLQTWLPDAMAGPTPVSALIHAATMVTAGVYLIARMHALFELAPPVLTAVALIGAATLLVSACSALVQRDIKRVLAYSTISQIGYMFLALGVGAWSAAMFHFMTHAFFKALLFLGAGVVIRAMHHEHDIFKMGGLRRQLPLTFWMFLLGASSLAALPLVTAGFYSKDLILEDVWLSPRGNAWLWSAGMVGALLTSLYTFRMVFLTFFGETKHEVARKPGPAMQLPLVVLGVLAVVGGFVEVPRTLGHHPWFSDFLHSTLPATASAEHATSTEVVLLIISAAVSLAGIGLAYMFYLRKPSAAANAVQGAFGSSLHRFWFRGWGFDALYHRLIVAPFVGLARAGANEMVDQVIHAIAWAMKCLHRLLSLTQTGQVRWYAMGVAAGAAVILAIVLIL